jgi:hypothetical protein
MRWGSSVVREPEIQKPCVCRGRGNCFLCLERTRPVNCARHTARMSRYSCHAPTVSRHVWRHKRDGRAPSGAGGGRGSHNVYLQTLTGHLRAMGLYIETQMPPTSETVPVLGINIWYLPSPLILFSLKNRGRRFWLVPCRRPR